MSKTFAHIRDQETCARIAQRQKRQRIMGTLTYGSLHDSTWDDTTLGDLAGMGPSVDPTRPAQEG